MDRPEIRRTAKLMRGAAFYSSLAAGAAVLIGGAMAVVALQSAQATPAFTAQTKLPCTNCHTSPAGGADHLTDFGKEFQANGNKLPKK